MEAFVNTLAQWVNPEWVAGRFHNGDGLPFVLWTLLVFALGAVAGARAERMTNSVPKPTPKRKIARGFSGDVKAAARAALESNGMVPVGQFEQSIVAFSREHPGVFVLSDPIEHVGSASAYQLAPEWRMYLKRHMRFLE